MSHPTEAAIRLPDCKVFVGHFHGHALELAFDAGYSDEALEKAKLGFSHPDGAAFYEAETIPLLKPIARDAAELPTVKVRAH